MQDRAADQLAVDSGGILTSHPQPDTDNVLGFNVRVPFPEHKVCRWSPYDGHVKSGPHMGASMLDGSSPYCIHCGRGQDWEKLAITTEEHFGHTWIVWRTTAEAIPPPTPPGADGSAEIVSPERISGQRARQPGDQIAPNLAVFLDATGHSRELQARRGPATYNELGCEDHDGPDCEISE